MSDLLGSHRSTNYLGGKCPVLGHINCNDSGFPILGTPAGCRTIYHFAGPESSGYFDLKAERRLLSLRRNVALRGLSLTRRHHPMGDAGSGAIHFSFNPQLRVEFWGATVTSTSVWVRSSRATSPNVVADAVANSGGGSLPPVYLQPFGGLRRHQRRGAAGRRPSVSDARVPRASGDVRRGHPGFGSRQMSAPRSETINGSLA